MIVYTDGGCKPKTGAYGSFRVEDKDGRLWHHSEILPLPHINTNNQAEYAMMCHCLEFCIKHGIKEATIYSDSLLMVSQIKGEWKINDETLKEMREKVIKLMENFDIIEIKHVSRGVIVGKLGH